MASLNQLMLNHKEIFRQKFVEALAKKNNMTHEQTLTEFKDSIDRYIDEKYAPVQQLIEEISDANQPVLLSIRRDRRREDSCKLCEGNQPNIDEIARKYGKSIDIIEITDDTPEGGSLYHIIFHEDAGEKKLPLTAVINRGEVLKSWAAKVVEPSVYEIYIKRILS